MRRERSQNALALSATSHGTPPGHAARSGLLAFRILDCGYLPDGIDWHFPNVRSPFWRLYFNRIPGWHVTHEGTTHSLGPDRLLLIASDTLFHCVGERGVPHLWIHFTPPLENTVALGAPLALPLDRTLQCSVEEVISAHQGGASMRLAHAAAALLHLAFARLQASPITVYPPRLEELHSFIEANLEGNLENSQLARRAAMSESAFIRWFRGLTGNTPAAWVQAARVKQAAQRLALSESSIEQIASDCGFPNRYYFSRVFRQHQGCGPAEYRRRQVR